MIFVLPHSAFLWVTKCGIEFSAINIMKNQLTLKSCVIPPEQLKEKIKIQTEPLLVKVIQKEQDPAKILQQIRCLNKLSEFSLIQDDISMAKEYAQLALFNCSKIHNAIDTYSIKSMEVEILTIIAAIKQQLDPVLAINFYKQALSLKQEVTASQFHYANWLQYVNLALSYLVIADCSSANDIYKLFQNVFPIDTGIFSKKYAMEQSLTNQGVITALDNNPKQAITLFKQILKDLPSCSLGAAIVNFNLFITYVNLNDEVLANSHRQHALKVFEKLIDINTHPLYKFLKSKITSKNHLQTDKDFPSFNSDKSNLSFLSGNNQNYTLLPELKNPRQIRPKIT